MVQCLSGKFKVLSSSPSTEKSLPLLICEHPGFCLSNETEEEGEVEDEKKKHEKKKGEGKETEKGGKMRGDPEVP